MPTRLGELDLPRVSPHFLTCRIAVRPYVTEAPVVVGLSGGADSLALTSAALAEGARVTAVCVDHGLQAGSRDVAERAAATARRLGADARVVAVDVPRAGSTEAAARQARYAALHGAGDGEVWVGHTLDDQAETYLLAALRGNPAGMLPRTGRVVRPLLTVRRADTTGACAELGLEPWDDPQNDDPAFRRVAVRRRVLPLLGEILGGDAAPPLARAAGRAAADDAHLTQLAGEPTGDCVELAADPGPIRRRRIAAWLRERGLAVTAASVTAIEALVTDWRGQGGVAVGGDATGRLEVSRVSGTLTLSSGVR